MHDLGDAGVGQQPGKRRQVRARERVDQRHLVSVGQLDERQLRQVGALAEEFGVQRDPGGAGMGGADGVQGVLVADQRQCGHVNLRGAP